MKIDLNIRFFADKEKPLCFRCAVKAATLGKFISLEIDEFGCDCDMRQVFCCECRRYILAD